MNPSCHFYGIILAGGRSSRFGQDKGLYPWRGKPLAEHARDILMPNVPNLAISTNNQEAYAYLGLPLIPDLVPGCGPLGGMYSALRYVSVVERKSEGARGREGEGAKRRKGEEEKGRKGEEEKGREGEGAKGIAVLSCDVPLVPPGLFALLMEHLGGYDAIVPVHQGFKETTCAIYTTACLHCFEQAIKDQRYKILDALTGTNTLFLDVSEESFYKPGIFHNINYMEDL